MSDAMLNTLLVVVAGQVVAVLGHWAHTRDRLKTIEVQAENDRNRLETYVKKTDKLTDEIHQLVVQMARAENRRARDKCDD